jgi:hypothetical protein
MATIEEDITLWSGKGSAKGLPEAHLDTSRSLELSILHVLNGRAIRVALAQNSSTIWSLDIIQGIQMKRLSSITMEVLEDVR